MISNNKLGIGYRREMQDWNCAALPVQFFEVAPENWVHRDLSPLRDLKNIAPIRFHGLSLNLGGTSAIDFQFLDKIKHLIQTFDVQYYSDHLACAGDQYFLYDLFPIPFNIKEAKRVADRIIHVQDYLNIQIAVENSSYYTNVEEMNEVEFLNEVTQRADCKILLDINNIDVNWKNHKILKPQAFLAQVHHARVSYLHVAGHIYHEDFHLCIDTHSAPIGKKVRQWAADYSAQHQKDILLEWDNDIPSFKRLNQELKWIQNAMTLFAGKQEKHHKAIAKMV